MKNLWVRIAGFGLLVWMIVWPVIGNCSDSGTAAVFVNVPSFLIVVGGSLGLLMFCCDKQTWGCFGRFVLGEGKELDNVELKKLILFFDVGLKGAIIFGLIGFSEGAVIMLMHMADYSMIGGAIAVSLITVFYGLILALLCIGGKTMAKMLMVDLDKPKKKDIPVSGNW